MKAVPGIAIENRQRAAPVDRERLARTLWRALDGEGLAGAEVTLLLVGDRRIHELNRRWRGVDRPTDVLAFPQREGEGGDLHPGVLGDVVISVATAARQAREAGRPLADELDLLAVHGVLHLAGYDHEAGPAAARKMRRREAALLGARGPARAAR